MKVARRGLRNAALGGAAIGLAPAAAQQLPRWDPLVPGTEAPRPKERMDRHDTAPVQLATADPFAPGAGIGIGHRFLPRPGQEVLDLYRGEPLRAAIRRAPSLA